MRYFSQFERDSVTLCNTPPVWLPQTCYSSLHVPFRVGCTTQLVFALPLSSSAGVWHISCSPGKRQHSRGVREEDCVYTPGLIVIPEMLARGVVVRKIIEVFPSPQIL
jgi:hypothetical protein